VVFVRAAFSVGIPQVESRGDGTEYAGRVDTVVVPVPGDEPVTGIAENELTVGDTLRVGVAEIDQSGGLTVQTDGVDEPRV